MTFEEFFKKKRIDLAALQSGEPGLYADFEKHFNQMGEKSFDHTKKYWFNKLRQTYHLASELKPEKIHIENRLAEQTIAESIIEEKIAPPSVGFKPRFKAAIGNTDKPADEAKVITPKVERDAATGDLTQVLPEQQAPMHDKAATISQTPDGESVDKVSNNPTSKPAGFKPRFKAGVTKSAENEVEGAKSEVESESPATDSSKPAGFTPKFKAGVTKPAEKEVEGAKSEVASESPKPAPPKPAGFTPRFKAGVTKAADKEVEDVKNPEEFEDKITEVSKVDDTRNPTEVPAKPVGFKPRFNAKLMKPKPPEEEK